MALLCTLLTLVLHTKVTFPEILFSTKGVYGKWCLRSEASEVTSLPLCHWVGKAWLCGANGVCKMRVSCRYWVVLPPLQSEERLQMRHFLGGEEGECTLAYKKFILRLRKRNGFPFIASDFIYDVKIVPRPETRTVGMLILQ